MILPKPKRVLSCKRCGKRVGTIVIKQAFNRKIIAWTLGFALITQLIGQFVSDILIRIIMNRHI